MPREPTIEEVRQYLIDGIVTPVCDDPEFAEFSRGYHAAMEGMFEDLFMTQEERVLARARTKGST